MNAEQERFEAWLTERGMQIGKYVMSMWWGSAATMPTYTNKHVEAMWKGWKACAGREIVAWRTFDGEGGYDYRSYEDNENYKEAWELLNPNHKGWVEALYL